jgi:hypothetical protein
MEADFCQFIFLETMFTGLLFRNVNKMAAWIPDNNKKIKETMFIVNN